MLTGAWFCKCSPAYPELPSSLFRLNSICLSRPSSAITTTQQPPSLHPPIQALLTGPKTLCTHLNLIRYTAIALRSGPPSIRQHPMEDWAWALLRTLVERIKESRTGISQSQAMTPRINTTKMPATAKALYSLLHARSDSASRDPATLDLKELQRLWFLRWGEGRCKTGSPPPRRNVLLPHLLCENTLAFKRKAKKIL